MCIDFPGQDGSLQSFSTVHEKFNKSLGHGKTFVAEHLDRIKSFRLPPP